MRRRSPKFYFLSLAIHMALLVMIYEIGCPRSIVRSEPIGLTVQVIAGDISRSAPAKAALRLAKSVNAPVSTGPSAVAKLGNEKNAATEKLGAPGAVSGVEAAAKERYLYELRLLLDAHKQYPAIARSLGHEGSVEVGFVLRSDGKIEEAGIVLPSSHPALNQAALQLVESVGKFKPLPTELQKVVGWRVSVPIEYRLR